MSEERNIDLKKKIRTLTKKIGQAIKENDHNEASNLRAQRCQFIETLVEEFDEYFILKDNKSTFVTLEEAKEHYENPDERKKVATAGVVSEMYQGREFLRKRYSNFNALTPENLKIKVLNEINEQINRLEKAINGLLKEVGKKHIDFTQADNDRTDDFLDGIDMSSLL